MAHYVLSDIHGEAERFHGMLKKISYGPGDKLYILGDVVDRGPDGIGLLLEIMDDPGMTMLLGNHEYMFLQCFRPWATEVDHSRWARNGNAPTLAGFQRLREKQQVEILGFLATLPTHLEVAVGARRFYLVHGFPGENVHDAVWGRPQPDTPNPIPDTTLLIGHTPVLNLGRSPEEQDQEVGALMARKDHLRIFHGPGFLDLDCGCGHMLPVKALACLRLEDMAEFYV